MQILDALWPLVLWLIAIVGVLIATQIVYYRIIKDND